MNDLTARAYNLPESDSPDTQRIGQPRRSQVAPVGDESGGDSSGTIDNLLAGLGSKAASEARAMAGTLEKLPAPHQLALRHALLAASESHKEAEIIQGELAKTKERLQRAEKDLLEESQAFSRQSAQAEAQVAGLMEDLAASMAATMATNQAFESRFRARGLYLWLALGTAMSAAIVCAFLLPRPGLSAASTALKKMGWNKVAQPDTSGSGVVPHRSREQIAWQPEAGPNRISGGSDTAARLRRKDPAAQPAMPHPVSESIEEQALDRLDRALDGVPLPEVDSVLHEANQWLKASGAPPCTVRAAEGKTSLLVTAGGKGDGPLAAALVRCAEAVEHVVE